MIIEFKNRIKTKFSNDYWKRENSILHIFSKIKDNISYKMKYNIFCIIKSHIFGPVWNRISFGLSSEIWRNIKERLNDYRI